MRQIRRSFQSVFILILLLGVHAAYAQKNALKIDYTVQLTDPASQQFHITTDIMNINQPRLDLSLPTWTPGWYTVENYFKNVLRFRITDASSRILPLTMSRKQTWNVDTKGIKQIRIDYDYRATVLALNQAKITKDFAFFTGIELFLQAEGHRNESSTVHFAIPSGWKIVTALRETSDPKVFTAADYDTLVDAPVEMGNFDVTKFEVEGKPHYFVANPAGTFSKEKSEKFVDMLSKIASAESSIFGGLPYEKYVYFYFFASPESNASGALEHLNSFVSFAPPGNFAQPEMIIDTAAHEFFHLWNVKRIRPAEMWPYDYSRENETPLLWVSEGFTNYYGLVAQYRAGLMTPEAFLARAAGAAGGVENEEARNYISPANSSVSTWAGYDTPVAFGISYYTQGQNLGALLDLSIRHDTGGSSSLDDVMRALFNEHYKRGRGFTTEDMIGIVNRLTKHDYHDFFRRFVWGVEVPPYETIFGYAGLRFDKKSSKTPWMGMRMNFVGEELVIDAILPNMPAASAGLLVGDILEKVNDQAPMSFRWQIAGETVKMSIRRDGKKMDIPFKIGSRETVAYSLTEIETSTPVQSKIRQGWLKR